MHDFYKFYVKDQLLKLLCDHLVENFDDYLIYHDCNPQELVNEAKEFFNEGNFNRDIVDLFVHATGILLTFSWTYFAGVQVGMFEIFQGNTKSSRCINLKLSGTGGKYTGDNHYDALPIKYKNLESLPPIDEQKGESEK